MRLPYFLLLPVFLVCALGSYLSYTEELRKSRWFLPAFLFLGLLVNAAFGYATVQLDNKEKIYVYAICFDCVIMTAYYLLPLLIFSTRPSSSVLFGVVVILIGLLIVKIYG